MLGIHLLLLTRYDSSRNVSLLILRRSFWRISPTIKKVGQSPASLTLSSVLIVFSLLSPSTRVEMNAAAASQLNKAIAHGAEKGTFVLPKVIIDL